MSGWSQLGKLLVFLGVSIAVVGGVLLLLSKIPWLGQLPGDIRIERKGFSCFFPLATSIIISLLLTVVLNIVVRLLRR
ncbi:MAG: DUF2905 domain-containing protein [Anaerolineae bacterium]|nr:DUF2905 domain-containing protein [Anaerolineae bacterium]